MKNTLTLIPLIICLSLLTGYNFMSAQWSASTANPPGNNTAAPINVSSTTQAKSGNFMANIVAAATSTWSPRYCDATGNNCFTASAVGSGGGGGITSLTGGSGITLSPTTITTTGTISINQSYTQRRITGTCPAGQAIRQINDDGTVVCQAAANTCLWKSQTYSQGARCRTGSLSCTVSGSSGYTFQSCNADGTWSYSSTGCSLSAGSLISCP